MVLSQKKEHSTKIDVLFVEFVGCILLALYTVPDQIYVIFRVMAVLQILLIVNLLHIFTIILTPSIRSVL